MRQGGAGRERKEKKKKCPTWFQRLALFGDEIKGGRDRSSDWPGREKDIPRRLIF